MFNLRNLVQAFLLTSALANIANAGHVRRYIDIDLATRAEALSSEMVHIDGLDFLSEYVCAPCDTNVKRSSPNLNIPVNDLATMYAELSTLKKAAINRMVAEGITPKKRSIIPLFSRKEEVAAGAEVSTADIEHLATYVCPSCPGLTKRQTRVTTNINITTNISINNVPASQLQSVLDRINQILAEIEAALRRFGIPIPEGSLPIPANPQPAPEQPAPAPTPAPTPAPEPAPSPRPTTTERTTTTTTRTVTATNGVITTVTVDLGTPAPTPTENCPETITVQSTTTIYTAAPSA